MLNVKIASLEARIARLENLIRTRTASAPSPHTIFEVVSSKTDKMLTSGNLDDLMQTFEDEPKVLHGLDQLKHGSKAEVMVETKHGWAVIRPKQLGGHFNLHMDYGHANGHANGGGRKSFGGGSNW